ncbi:MAG: hypothetical protein IJI83_05885 [Oscillospiraceae bacterium]|nr:hypothetical protein [Oscillospiraceae bacterium]
MNKKTNEHWPTILINEGKPYVLKELNRQGINNPCSLCDLRLLCNNEKGQGFIYALCTSDNRDDGWYFEEDWTIYGDAIADFVGDIV